MLSVIDLASTYTVARLLPDKNLLSQRAGFSPSHWVLGIEQDLPESIFDNTGNIAVHSQVLGDTSLRRRARIRELSRKPWIRPKESDKLRKAQCTRHLTHDLQYYSGEQIYFFCQIMQDIPTVLLAGMGLALLLPSRNRALFGHPGTVLS